MELLLLGAILVLVSSSVYGPPFFKAARTYSRLRKRREIICPETGRPASVQVDAFRAVRTVLTGGVADVQVRDCARWPRRRGCEQNCLSKDLLSETPEAPEGDHAHRFRRQGV